MSSHNFAALKTTRISFRPQKKSKNHFYLGQSKQTYDSRKIYTEIFTHFSQTWAAFLVELAFKAWVIKKFSFRCFCGPNFRCEGNWFKSLLNCFLFWFLFTSLLKHDSDFAFLSFIAHAVILAPPSFCFVITRANFVAFFSSFFCFNAQWSNQHGLSQIAQSKNELISLIESIPQPSDIFSTAWKINNLWGHLTETLQIICHFYTQPRQNTADKPTHNLISRAVHKSRDYLA